VKDLSNKDFSLLLRMTELRDISSDFEICILALKFFYMVESIFFSFWFFAPAGFANLAAFAAGKITFLKQFNYPVDGYQKLRGKRILGDHKTIRGFIAAIIFGIIICSLQVYLYQTFSGIRAIIPFDYGLINAVLLGFLLGFGALFGDSVKSFFKRQKGVKPGRSWFPFDQIDYIVGGVAFSMLYIRLNFWEYIILFIVWFLIHPLTTFIGYLFKLRHKPL
jgi:CDP-2,3-bis-(O-geranylgeranyl)-sn-glycerol synthase